MKERIEANVNPWLLVWARETRAFSVEEASKKLGITAEKLQAWERGATKPTLRQLREAARVYRRPLVAFYLPQPPQVEELAAHDFRHISPGTTHSLTPELRLELRRARERRHIAVTLAEELGEKIPSFSYKATLSEDVEKVGTRCRDILQAPTLEQLKNNSPHRALSRWRSKIERLGILAFQTGELSTEQMMGFSISEELFPVIVINSKYTPPARIFTLLHEFTHLLLRRAGVCPQDDNIEARSEDEQVEAFCNAVAAATVLPREQLLKYPLLHQAEKSHWSDDELRQIANSFSVSQEAVLRRLLTLGRTTKIFYQKKRVEFEQRYADLKQPRRQSEGGLPRPQLVIPQYGVSYVNLVLQAHHQDLITRSDVCDYLGIRVKHLSELETELGAQAAGPA